MGPRPEGPRAVGGNGGWTDNVARVHEVIRRHPEVSVEWPAWSGRREFRAHWPVNPGDEDSEIRSVQTRDLAGLAAALEEEFPDKPGTVTP